MEISTSSEICNENHLCLYPLDVFKLLIYVIMFGFYAFRVFKGMATILNLSWKDKLR